MQKIKDFCNKHKKMCIAVSAILVLILLVAVIVAVVLHVPSKETDTAKPNSISQTSGVSDPQNGEDATSAENNSAGATEVNSAAVSGTGSSAVSGANMANSGGNANADSSGNQGSASAGGAGSSQSSAGSGSGTPASGGPSSGSAGTSHQHNWKDHVVTVTVEDEPAQTKKVTTYKMYYWDSKTWKTSEDPDDFKDWEKQKMVWMKTYRYENNMPPELFKGYDKNGNPQYTNDHSIITSYKTVPAVTHKEQRVDYQYCTVCGMKK